MLRKHSSLPIETRERLNQIEGIYCVGSEILGSKAAYSYDPTKLIISVKSLGLTGHDVEKWLRESFNIEVELSDCTIFCVFSLLETAKMMQTACRGLTEIANSRCQNRCNTSANLRFCFQKYLCWR